MLLCASADTQLACKWASLICKPRLEALLSPGGDLGLMLQAKRRQGSITSSAALLEAPPAFEGLPLVDITAALGNALDAGCIQEKQDRPFGRRKANEVKAKLFASSLMHELMPMTFDAHMKAIGSCQAPVHIACIP